MKKKIVLLLLAGGLLFAGYTWVTLNFVYSHGERVGYLQKLSEKGWLFKTWEGEIAIINVPGSQPEIFHFSVRHKPAVQKLLAQLGQRVSLSYNEHRGIPSNIFGETRYFARDVTPAPAAAQ